MWTSRRNLWALLLLAIAPACENPALDEPLDVETDGEAGAPAEGRNPAAPTAGANRPFASLGEPSGPRLRGEPCEGGAGACDGSLAGTYAVAMNLDVYWHDAQNGGAPVFDPGRGTLRIVWMSKLGDLCPDDSQGESLARVCDVQFPTVYSDASGTALRLRVPDAAWEQRAMRAVTAPARASAGDVMIERVTSTYGLELADAHAPWPTYDETPFVSCSDGRTGADCFVDQDLDGLPGISLQVQRGGEAASPGYRRAGGFRYAPAPSDPNAAWVARGATVLHAGLRTSLGGLHPVGTDCRGGSGRAAADEIALRVLDCDLDDGSACSGANATYVDRNLPVFHLLGEGEAPPVAWKHARPDADAALARRPSDGAWNTVVRLGDLDDDLSCADVRAVFEAR